MQVLVTGANGFVGQVLCRVLDASGHSITATGRAAMAKDPVTGIAYLSADIRDRSSIEKIFQSFGPFDVVIHAAAMSKADECEVHRAAAREVNVKGTIHVATLSHLHQSHFIFLSTDFVFDGAKGMYSESDTPRPINFYGETKYEAEQFIMQQPMPWTIVRTVLVYGHSIGNTNFVETIAAKLLRGEKIKLVADQVRTPTWVNDLASGLRSLTATAKQGIYHLSGADILTPFDMGIRIARLLGKPEELIERVTADTFPEPARRPLRTGFDISKAKMELGFSPHRFDDALLSILKK